MTIILAYLYSYKRMILLQYLISFQYAAGNLFNAARKCFA